MIPAENIRTAQTALAAIGATLAALGVSSVYLFGSRTRADFKSASDWDLLVNFSRPITPRELAGLRVAVSQALIGSVGITSPQYSTDPGFIRMIAPQCSAVWPVNV